ncbi:MAG: hypothetical protein A2381_00300 [Bdellovibrionales bacterium RIFOXYB1_FULL_37_110]|nr:MAG: hypothetical protein A2417_11355 [Bdellovibrionales bacterium RIFOXYC1_FULL_37_79]OFZ60834.1 MAG: hypothetical protein A2381_00300 [Bdellovibrionales bacterium RIFOXYB1_FULL_37_110]OFZ62364.1 MAG: hypothetical protein A2577_02965 [Bdellovibrionales bacterium RIFOXYD1_FULL_36_51]OFZ67358.1 MAG: hypothetical protein A2328_10435 [Bdellovibrionales bacterium RIFOXYB2_FULL_36_6]
MNWVINFMLVLLLYSCASTQQSDNLDFEFDSISNEDFKVIEEVPYREHEDVFEDVEVNDDSLAKESMARVSEPKLMVVENKVSNVISKGISLCYRKQFDSAFEIFDRTYFAFKNHPSYWNQIGTCYFLKGETKKAFLYYNKARDLNPNYVPAINNHGVIYQQEGDHYKALKVYEKASKLNSFVLTPLFNIGQLYLRYGFAEKAKNIFKSLLNKNPGDVDALNGMAMSYFMLGNTSGALAYWQKINNESLEEPYIGLNYAVALKMLGKKQEAASVLDKINDAKLGQLANYYKKVKNYIGVQ